ncbi:MAG: phosphatidylserine/phosphatidylglycerophosphate/cardiolipin synthase family protein [bacterium]
MAQVLLLLLLALRPAVVIETAPRGLNTAGVPDAIEVLPALFAAAESSIDVAQMYMLHYPPASRGRLLYRLYDELVAAASRGVRVRVMVDGLTWEQNPGSGYRSMVDRLGAVPGIEARHADLRAHSEYDGCLMHAKYCVIDAGVSVLGSHNWSWGAFAENRELSLVLRDSLFARALGALFQQDWSAAGGNPAPAAAVTTGRTRLAFAGPGGLPADGLRLDAALKELLGRTTRSLDLAVNSFSTRADLGAGPFLLVDSLLRDAADRGVAVRILVDRWAWEHDSTSLRSLDSVTGVSVRVADIRDAGEMAGVGTMHAKLLVADAELVLLGSATLSQRQLLECRNVAALVHDPVVAAELQALFERDWSSGWCRPVTD